MRRPRGSSVFLGPVEISGIVAGLLDGLQRIGVDAHAGLAAPHPFGYAGSQPRSTLLVRWAELGRRRRETPRSRLAPKVVYRTAHQAVAWMVLLRELQQSWAFVYLFGETITNTRLELLLLRLMRKRVVFIYVGSDARPRWMDCVEAPAESHRELARLRRVVYQQRRRIRRQESIATACVSARTTAQFLTQPFVDSLAFGLPLILESEFSPHAEAIPSPVRILHSPSNPRVKGSAHVAAAMRTLQESGLDIDFVTLTGKPHVEVLREISRCDFVVDQVFSDLPWSGFAAEAASMAKPAVIAGYAAEWYRQQVPVEAIPPSFYVLPQDLTAAVAALATDAGKRRALGDDARRYAETRWSSSLVATRLVALLANRGERDWMVDPSQSAYVCGCGCPLALVQAQARNLVRKFGVSSLCLPESPAYLGAVSELLGMTERWGP